MRKISLHLAMLATLAAFTTVVHADISVVQATITTDVTATGIVYSFSGLTLEGFEFLQVGGGLAAPVYGTLTSVSVNATLDASVDDTFGDDLTIYVNASPLDFGGLLQVGGFSDLMAAERHPWINGGSSLPGTTVVDTVTLATPLTFVGATNPVIWLGNGYGGLSTEGAWTGSITLTGLSNTPAPVPEPSALALMALGGLGLAGCLGRRRRTIAV